MGHFTINTAGGGLLLPQDTMKLVHEVEIERVQTVVAKFAQSPAVRSDENVCYIYGMGAHPKSTYLDIRKTVVGVNVIWFESVLPKYARFFQALIASYCGLIKIDDPEEIPSTFLKLIENSMAAIYCFNRSLESEFLAAVKQKPHSNNYCFNIASDNRFFAYIVDADSYESPTGIYEIILHGDGAPIDLVAAVSQHSSDTK